MLRDEDGRTRRCHLRDPGRLHHLLHPGAELLYRDAWRPGRATDCTVVAAREPSTGTLVFEDSTLANRLFPRAAALVVPGLQAETLRPEPRAAGARLDFAGVDEEGRLVLVEVKSTNLVERGVALFPDAPSTRARRQVEALAQAARAGARAVVVITVLRGDAHIAAVNRAVDPALDRLICARREVELRAYAVEPVLQGSTLEARYKGVLEARRC